MAEALFEVREPLLCNGVFYAVGSEARLPADIAASLIASGAVVPKQEAPKKRKEAAKD